MPKVSVKSMAGDRDIRLGGGGRVVLLDIWASWCAPCKEELPLLDDMAGRLKKRGIEIIAVSVDEEKASAEDFLRARPSWTLTLAHDPAGRVPELLQPPKMPTSYIIDASGVIRHVNAGFERGDVTRIEAQLVDLAGH
jgi:thiol-disulfide isomerase/thioredoxin